MKTPLDVSRSWFLESAVKTEKLVVTVEEGIAGEPEPLIIAGKDLGLVRPLEVRPNSRRYQLVFDEIVAWQIVDESYTAADENELADDDGAVRIIENSTYMDYVTANHGWYLEVRGPAKLYRIHTERDIVEVVAYEPPRVSSVST